MSVTITNLDTKMTWHFDRSVRSTPHPFVVANQLVPTSYISLEMVLGYYSLIPEYVAVITSVTMGLPLETENRYGRFIYQQMDTDYFFGIEHRLIADDQYTYMAYPEKALLDLLYFRLYLQPKQNPTAFIESLRLQNLEQLNLERLQRFAAHFQAPIFDHAVNVIACLAETEVEEFEWL